MTDEQLTPEQISEKLFPPNEAFWQKFAAELARERWERRSKEVRDGIQKTSDMVAGWASRDQEKIPWYTETAPNYYKHTNDPEIPTGERYITFLEEAQALFGPIEQEQQ